MKKTITRVILVTLLLLTTGTALADPPVGHWEGAIELPNAVLTVKIDLAQGADGAWSGTIDIPQQGAVGLALTGIRAAADSVTFAIADIPGAPTFAGAMGKDGIRGTFSQGGTAFPFHLGREIAPPPARPQEPKPPFPYLAEEVGFASGDVHLAGTLTIPAGDGPFPAAVLLTGSGSQNRDEEIFGHKPFLVLADFLSRRGVAVLRCDDRGVGGSGGSTRNSTTSDFADDALAGVRFLRARPEIAADQVGLIGHSEGGIVGPLAASRSPGEVAFVVMMAGTGVPLGEVVLRQVALITAAAGADSAAVAKEVATTTLVLDLVAAGADSLTIRGELEAAIRAAEPTLTAEQQAGTVDGHLAGILSPWFRYAVTLDPRVALRRLVCPVLAINGELDLQVDPEQNLPEIERALAEAGNPDVTIVRLPGLNHVFQPAGTGSPTEYGTIEETIDPKALTAIGDWIGARFGPR